MIGMAGLCWPNTVNSYSKSQTSFLCSLNPFEKYMQAILDQTDEKFWELH
jgi:hypothetical protein